MPDQTARDAVRNALDRDVPYLGPEGREQRVENVLAALGIPPEMPASEVARAISTHVQTRAWQERVIAEQRDLTADQEDAT